MKNLRKIGVSSINTTLTGGHAHKGLKCDLFRIEPRHPSRAEFNLKQRAAVPRHRYQIHGTTVSRLAVIPTHEIN